MYTLVLVTRTLVEIRLVSCAKRIDGLRCRWRKAYVLCTIHYARRNFQSNSDKLIYSAMRPCERQIILFTLMYCNRNNIICILVLIIWYGLFAYTRTAYRAVRYYYYSLSNNASIKTSIMVLRVCFQNVSISQYILLFESSTFSWTFSKTDDRC